MKGKLDGNEDSGAVASLKLIKTNNFENTLYYPLVWSTDNFAGPTKHRA